MERGVYPGEQRLDMDGVQQGVVVQVHRRLRHDEAPAPADGEEVVDTGNKHSVVGRVGTTRREG